MFVDFSVPWDRNVVTKEGGKITNCSLAKEIRKIHRLSTTIVPFVVGGWLCGCGVWSVGRFLERSWDSLYSQTLIIWASIIRIFRLSRLAPLVPVFHAY